MTNLFNKSSSSLRAQRGRDGVDVGTVDLDAKARQAVVPRLPVGKSIGALCLGLGSGSSVDCWLDREYREVCL